MANKKINQLVSKTSILSTDLFGIGDATTGQLFKKTIAELQAAIGGAVISVNGLVGTVVLDTDDIQELATPTNKYFTDARARGAISLTVTGNSGASTYSSGTGVLNVPTYTLAGLGGITASFLSGTSGISYNSTTGVISYSGTVYTDASIRALFSGSTGITYNSSTGAISYSGTVYTDSSVRALISLTTTGTSGASTYNNTTGVINVPNYTLAGLGGITLASLSGSGSVSYNSSTGVISSSITQYTDALARASISLTTTGTSGASTYNSTTGVFNIPQYQAVLTNPVTGTGTTNYVAKFTSSSAIGNSLIFDNGTNVGINTTAPVSILSLSSNNPIISLIRSDNSATASGGINFYAVSTLKWQIGTSLVSGTNGFEFNFAGSNVALMNTAGSMGFGTNQLVGNVTAAQVTANMTASRSQIAITTGGNYGNIIGSGVEKYLDLSYYGFNNNEVARIRSWDESNVTLNGSLTFWTLPAGGSVTERLRITSAGNVGIGTTTPNRSLVVSGGNAEQLVLISSTTSCGLSLNPSNTSFSPYIGATGNDIILQTSGATRLTIASAGAATFSSTVFATDFFVPANEGIAFNGQGSFKTAIYSRNSGADLVFNAGDSEKMRLETGGNLLLGTSTNNGERLYVSGAIRATGTITANSDITLKKNLLKIENALEKVEQINGYTYEFKEDDSKRHAGVIAQEIQTVLPEIVNKGNDGILGVEYGNISALLIEAIKEQNIKIKNLETLLASK